MLVTQTTGWIHGLAHAEGGRMARWVTAVVACCLALFAFPRCGRAADGWLTDYDAALATATSTGRPVLALFTGSDWCPHCKTLEHNVFGSDVFQAWAKDNVVLLMVDLPQAGISQAVRNERSQICINYGVRTFPSVLLLGPDGRKITAQTGYKGQSAGEWLTSMQAHMPAPQVAQEEESLGETAKIHESLDEAVATARGARRPILLVVARPGDTKARSHSESLINDPEFEAFAHDNFVVASVPPADRSGTQADQTMEQLLGGVDLAPEAVELIVTDDGQTPLFSQSASQPPQRIVSGLRRFLAARQSARTVSQRR